MLGFFVQGFSLGLSGAASPGPFQAYLINQSLKLGWRRALPVALAPLVSDGPIILLMLLVLTQLPPGVLRAIQIAGGLFVIYLAWKAFQGWRTFKLVEAALPEGEQGRSLLGAIGMNFLSPGPYIYWSMVSGPVLVRGWQISPAHGVTFLGGFYAAMVGGLALLVILFGAARQLGPKVNRALLGISALALFGFGLYQLWQGVLG